MGNLDLLGPNIFGKKAKPPGNHTSEWTYRTRVQNFRVNLLKRRGRLDFSGEKCIICVNAFNYFVSVEYKL